MVPPSQPNNTPSITPSISRLTSPERPEISDRPLRRSNAIIFNENTNLDDLTEFGNRPQNNYTETDNESIMSFEADEDAFDGSYADTNSLITPEEMLAFDKRNDFDYNYEEDSDDYTDIYGSSENVIDNERTDNESTDVGFDGLKDGKASVDDDGNCKNVNLDENEFKWIKNNCFNCENKLSLGPFDKEEYSNIISIKIQNSEGLYIKGTCLTKDDIKAFLTSDINDMYPNGIMSIYNIPKKSLEESQFVSGLTAKATGRIVIKLPIVDIFVTLNSASRILKETNNIWYALELFGGKRRRIGNIQTHFGSSLNHGQIKGFKVYKLFTKEEIQKGVVCTETRSDYPLSLFLFDKMDTLNNILGINYTAEKIIDAFKRSIINLLLNNNENEKI